MHSISGYMRCVWKKVLVEIVDEIVHTVLAASKTLEDQLAVRMEACLIIDSRILPNRLKGVVGRDGIAKL